jgi:hypothetical protein
MFRFTIRDVLWLTVVVALGAAWWIDHSQSKAARLRAEQAQAKAEGDYKETLDALVEGPIGAGH